MDWKPLNWFPSFRTGLSFGGETDLGWAMGIGIDAGLVEMNISTSNMEPLVAPNSARQVSVAFSSRWKF